MSILEIFILAIGLSMDTFAVSVSSGAVMKQMQWLRVFKIVLFLSVFQAMMPVAGWAAGESFSHYIQTWDHWVAFALLAFLGGKMLIDGATTTSSEEDIPCASQKCRPWHTRVLLAMAIATSIDAAAVGISFSFLQTNITMAAVVILIVTAVFAYMGMWIGMRFGKRYRKRSEVLGGVILMAIGTKILIEHLFFA